MPGIGSLSRLLFLWRALLFRKPQRLIVIGDVHGCYEEARELIRLADRRKGRDRICFIGDLINKGPDSLGCFRMRKELNALCLMGNHEKKILDAARQPEPGGKYFQKLKREFKGDFSAMLESIAGLPYFIETPKFDLVHAGIAPSRSLRDTAPHDLINLRKVRTGRSGVPRPWFDCYDGKKTVVFGHWARLGGIVRDNVIGLDTGCVYGNRLRAVILPDREIIEVEAKEAYCPVET